MSYRQTSLFVICANGCLLLFCQLKDFAISAAHASHGEKKPEGHTQNKYLPFFQPRHCTHSSPKCVKLICFPKSDVRGLGAALHVCTFHKCAYLYVFWQGIYYN